MTTWEMKVNCNQSNPFEAFTSRTWHMAFSPAVAIFHRSHFKALAPETPSRHSFFLNANGFIPTAWIVRHPPCQRGTIRAHVGPSIKRHLFNNACSRG